MVKYLFSFFLLLSINGTGQSCNLAMSFLTAGAPRYAEYTNGDSILNIYTNLGLISSYNRTTLQYFAYNRFSIDDLLCNGFAKSQNNILVEDMGELKVIDKEGKIIFSKKTDVKSRIYSLDLNDSFIVLNYSKNITLINYRQNTVKEIKNTSQNVWFIKIIDDNIMYIDSSYHLSLLNIHSGSALRINKVTSTDDLKYFEKNKNEFYLYNKKYTYCYKDNRIIKSIPSPGSNFVKLVINADNEYFYDSSVSSVVVRELITGKQTSYKISVITRNDAYKQVDTLRSNLHQTANLNIYQTDWSISKDGKSLLGYYGRSGAFVMLNLIPKNE